MIARGLPGLVAALSLLTAAPALAVPPQPITEGPDAATLPKFSGRPADQRPVAVPDPPRHPFMAPNGRSNLHVDGYQSDVHQGPGPLGRQMEKRSTFLEGVCASVTFDSRGRIETVCVGVEGPKLLLLEPRTLETLAVFPLPPRVPGGGNLFTDFAGGGYFFLDHRDRAVIPTTSRHVYVIRQTGGGTGFAIERDYDLSTAVLPGDKIISALPDWSGRLWFASTSGVVGTIDPASGTVRSRPLGERIANSFAVENTGARLHGHRRGAVPAGGGPDRPARGRLARGLRELRRAEAGAGERRVRHDADADGRRPRRDHRQRRPDERARLPPRPQRARRAADLPPARVREGRERDRPVADRHGPSLVVENNYGYSGPVATQQGGTTSPGLERVDLDPGGGCHSVWRSAERAPSVVPKLSAANGLVYTYTKDPQPQDPTADAWYLTALDFRSGRTVYKRARRRGLRPQQQLRAGHARPRRHRLRRRARRPRSRCATACRRRGRRRPAVAPACGGCGCTCGGWGAGGARGCGCWAGGRGWCGGWTSTGGASAWRGTGGGRSGVWCGWGGGGFG